MKANLYRKDSQFLFNYCTKKVSKKMNKCGTLLRLWRKDGMAKGKMAFFMENGLKGGRKNEWEKQCHRDAWNLKTLCVVNRQERRGITRRETWRASLLCVQKRNPFWKHYEIQGVQEKLCFFTILCNPSLAYIAVRDLQSSQRIASVQSLRLAGNFLYNQ